MRIIKVINNNVALVRNERGKQLIIKGKGIAYQRQKGEWVNEQEVEQFFYLSEKETYERFEELVTEIPAEYFHLANQIIDQAKQLLGKKLNESIYLSLADHLYNTIERKKEGIELKNDLLWEIKRFYPDEFTIGSLALKAIKKSFDLSLAEDEAGFIALHFVNAETQEESVDAYKVTKLIQEIATIVRYFFTIDFNQESIYYYRFITHLKFFAQRVISEKIHKSNEDPEMMRFMKNKYKQAYQCVEKINEFLKNNYQYDLSDEESLYLTVHIQKMISN